MKKLMIWLLRRMSWEDIRFVIDEVLDGTGCHIHRNPPKGRAK